MKVRFTAVYEKIAREEGGGYVAYSGYQQDFYGFASSGNQEPDGHQDMQTTWGPSPAEMKLHYYANLAMGPHSLQGIG